MRRIILKEARPGMVVARNLAHPGDPASRLASSGETLAAGQLAQFHEQGVYDLWISDPGLDFLDDLCASQSTRPEQRLAEALRDAMLRVSSNASRTLCRRHDITVEELLRSLMRTASVVPGLAALSEDEGLLAHSADVAVLSMYLGLILESYLVGQRPRLNCRQARDVVNLVVGACFHDIGEVMLPASQRESRLLTTGTLNGDSDSWKHHTVEGYQMVRGRLDPSAAAILQNHHQHFDGTGFGGLPGSRPQSGETIHIFARIVMAADTFCQVHAPAGGQITQPMSKSLWRIGQPPRARLIDPKILEALRALFPPFVEGTLVTLSDDRTALVSKTFAEHPAMPEVQIIRQVGHSGTAPERIFLAEKPNLSIISIAGAEVGESQTGGLGARPRTLVAA